MPRASRSVIEPPGSFDVHLGGAHGGGAHAMGLAIDLDRHIDALGVGAEPHGGLHAPRGGSPAGPPASDAG